MSAALPVAIFSAGCLTELDRQDESEAVNVEEAEQAFSGSWSYSWGDTRYSRADLGPAADRACFLSGIAGFLTTNTFPDGGLQGGAGVEIDPITNHWTLYVDPAFATVTLQVWARCVSATSLTPSATWRAGQPRKLLAPVTANRRCFFTELTTGRDDEFPHGGFQSPTDTVWIGNDGIDWYIDGTTSGLVWATAACIDVTQDLGSFFGYAPEGSTTTTRLVPATDGAACFPTQLIGKLDATTDWVQGPYVTYNPTSNLFDLKSKNGSGGRVRCVR